MILIDSNIPMYIVGADHPHKRDAQLRLEQLLAENQRLVTDAEVLQEILHRYASIRRLDAIGPATEALLAIVDEVFPVRLEDVRRAAEILVAAKRLSSRDALHLAIMEAREVGTILSFDRGFDGHPGVKRIGEL
jgi:predicted nucleic acid-binding protein